jgi:hypothetical protein
MTANANYVRSRLKELMLAYREHFGKETDFLTKTTVLKLKIVHAISGGELF